MFSQQNRERLNPNINIEQGFEKRAKKTLSQKFGELRREFQDTLTKYNKSGNNGVDTFAKFTSVLSVQYLWVAMQHYNCQQFIERTVCRIVSVGEGVSGTYATPAAMEPRRSAPPEVSRVSKRRKVEKVKANSVDGDNSLEKMLGDYLSVSTSLLLKGKMSSQSPPNSQEDERTRKEKEKATRELENLKDRLIKAWGEVEKCEHLPSRHPHRRAMERDYRLKFKMFEKKTEEVYGSDYDEIEDDLESFL
tara:strand:+ start:775 stop:1521 length:747 start_codon:yes stop_codon:yes gene_type:complete